MTMFETWREITLYRAGHRGRW